MASARPAGFTMVELMIGLAITALLVVLALPGYSVWIADAQIRNAAESIASGLRYAQGQAVARNSSMEFTMITTPGSEGWQANLVINATTLQQAVFAEGSSASTRTLLPAGATTVTFTSLGGIAANANASPTLTEVDVTSPVAGARVLNVLVGAGRTGIKICDPKWPATDPKGCP